jgi:hypothetical protein
MESKIASALVFALGAMSIIAGGKAMRGWNPGYSVLAWLPIYNFLMGIMTLIPAILIWVNSRYAMIVSLVTFGIHALVLALLLTVFRDAVARQSIAAMSFRLATWLIVLALILISVRKAR